MKSKQRPSKAAVPREVRRLQKLLESDRVKLDPPDLTSADWRITVGCTDELVKFRYRRELGFVFRTSISMPGETSVRVYPDAQTAVRRIHQEMTIRRGKALIRKLKRACNGCLSLAETAELLGISPATVLQLHKDLKLVAWRDNKAVPRFPKWQFRGRRILPGVEQVLQTLGNDDQWSVMAYFLGRSKTLNGKRALDLLREGGLEKLLWHAAMGNPSGTVEGPGPIPQGNQMWQSTDNEHPSITATCIYKPGYFTVVVRHSSGAEKIKSFRAAYEPRWGMDVEDMAMSQQVAEKLANELASELDLPPAS
jgi:hypothetical protein